MRKSIIVAGIVAGLTTALGASAQETGGQASGQANVGMSLPGSAPATATAGASDHDQVVGRLAATYFGVTNVGAGANIANLAGAGNAIGAYDSPYSVTGFAPVVGIRYWLQNMIGIDAGVGLSIVGGSSHADPGDVNADHNSFTAFVFHAGVPLALASADHFTFEVIPEANIAIASAGEDPDPNAAGDISHSGFHFDVGARAGAEIHFGFIKVPQLSLQASVGLRFDYDKGKSTDTQPAGADIEATSSRSEFHTTVQGAPWAIFTNNIAALYYF